MYKGDYYPRLMHDKRKDTWELEDSGSEQSTIYQRSIKADLLKDTVI